MKHEVRVDDAVEVRGERPERNGRTDWDTLLAAKGAVNGKPFVASVYVGLDAHGFHCLGHLLTTNEQDAVRRALLKADKRVVDLGREWTQRAEAESVRDLLDVQLTWLHVPDNSMNVTVRRLGGLFFDSQSCWATMSVDLAPFEAAGIAARPVPVWRRVELDGKADRDGLKAAGARWDLGCWWFDVAVADREALAEACDRMGLRVMETRAETGEWVDREWDALRQVPFSKAAEAGFPGWDWDGSRPGNAPSR